MRGITVPERTEDFTADPVELFFDLAFVFAYSRLVYTLVHDPAWGGIGEAALLFALMWLPWSQFTWSANAVSGNGRGVRALFLVATAVCVPMAASVSTAFEDGGPVFAVCLGVITIIGMATMGLGDALDDSERSAISMWVSINVVALVLLVVGAFLDDELRISAWLVSAVVVFVAMVEAGRGDWLVRAGHMAERHALITIIALGEVIVAIGIAVVDPLEGGEGLPRATVTALIASGLFVGLLWWSYFDRPAKALEHRAEDLEGRELSRYVRDVYTWAHIFIVFGIVLAAAGLEDITLHPTEPTPTSFRFMLVGGLCVAAVGVCGAVWRAFRVVAKERAAAGGLLLVLAAVSGDVDGVVLLVLVDLVLLATLVVEHRRIER